MKSLNDSIKESFEILLENISFKKPQGIATGYPRFDNMLRGMNKGTLTVAPVFTVAGFNEDVEAVSPLMPGSV